MKSYQELLEKINGCQIVDVERKEQGRLIIVLDKKVSGSINNDLLCLDLQIENDDIVVYTGSAFCTKLQ